jgi:hypothetical protein
MTKKITLKKPADAEVSPEKTTTMRPAEVPKDLQPNTGQKDPETPDESPEVTETKKTTVSEPCICPQYVSGKDNNGCGCIIGMCSQRNRDLLHCPVHDGDPLAKKNTQPPGSAVITGPVICGNPNHRIIVANPNAFRQVTTKPAGPVSLNTNTQMHMQNGDRIERGN